MGRVEGKVAFITGAARGQGRSHALRLAEEGADIIAVDVCEQLDSVPYPMATPDDLAETVKLVEEMDRRIVARQADVRDAAKIQAVVDEGLSELGHIDIVCANAGIGTFGPSWEMGEDMWQEMIDVNLTGVWKTLKAVIPAMIAAERGGSIVLTSSVAGLIGYPNLLPYTAAKHGVVGIMRVLSMELAAHRIRVNTVNPTIVATPMVQNPAIYGLFMPGVENPSLGEAETLMKAYHALPIPWVESIDISNAVLWLASDEARYVTNITLAIDAGFLSPTKIPHEMTGA